MMILVWTDYRHKEHRTDEDNERRVQNIYVAPGQYFCIFPSMDFVLEGNPSVV